VLARPGADESGRSSSASLFHDEGPPPYEKRILGLLKADQATHIDEIVEQRGTDMSALGDFWALLESELVGKVRQMSGKNFVKSFEKQRLASGSNEGGDRWKTPKICEYGPRLVN
jgi:DNA processing protein